MPKIYDIIYQGEYLGRAEFDGPPEALAAWIEELDQEPREAFFQRLREQAAARDSFEEDGLRAVFDI